MKKQFLSIAVLIVTLVGLSAQAALAQSKAQVAVMRTTADPGEDSVAVNVLFTVLDNTGQAVPKEKVRFEGEGQAFGPSMANVPATVTEAKTPIKIALVIDASGSMAQEINDVRTAAINFVGKAPEAAEIAVFKFSQEVEQVQGFTPKAQIGLVENAIKTITNVPPGTGNTCIYKAAFAAINAANSGLDQNSGARPAVVLFTDGRDSEAGSCGEIKEPDVVKQALQSNPVVTTQVHTIGLCDPAGCGNIAAEALRTLAKETHALTTAGKLGELDALFGTILSALNNQWLATANLKPDEAGTHRVTFDLNANVDGTAAPIALTTQFESPGYGDKPSIVIKGLHPNKNKREYTLELEVTNPEQVKQMTAVLRSASNLTVWREPVTNISGTTTVKIPATAMAEIKEGSEFVVGIDAVNKDGGEIKDPEGKALAIKGVHSPEARKQLSFEFGLSTYDAAQQAFIVKLSQVQREEDAKLLYKGSVTEDDRPVMEIPEGVYNGSDIVLKLPATEVKQLSEATQSKKYKIKLTMFEVGGQSVTQETATVAQPAPPIPLWQRVVDALGNPVVWGSIAGIFVVVAGVIAVTSRRKPKQAIPTPLYNGQTVMPERKEVPKALVRSAPKEPSRSQPAGGQTEIADPVVAAEPELRINVVATPDLKQNRSAVINRFPCVIGRENSSFLIAGDPKVSRQHAEIAVHGKQIIIKDLRSGNGTAFVIRDPKNPGAFIEKKRLEKGGSAEWDHQSIIRLGPSTFLELKPEGSLQSSSPHTVMHDNFDNRTEIFG